MITIKCTEYEKRKLYNHDYNIMCAMVNALGHCDADCGKCKRNRGKYIKWEIQKKPKKVQDKPLKQQVREKSDGPFFGCMGK